MKTLILFIINLRTDFLLFLFRQITRLHKNRIIFWSTNGGQYSCNPKYLTEYLVKHHCGEFDIYWAFAPRMMKVCVPSGIKKVSLYRWSPHVPSIPFLYFLSGSHFIVTNFRSHGSNGMRSKRKGQKFIQTWHASWGIKPIEAEMVGYDNEKHQLQYRENSITDLMLSSCPARTKQIREGQGYKGKILETGTPRVDLFFLRQQCFEEISKKVHDYYGISKDMKIILYAPTFRDGDIRNTDVFCVNWNKIVDALNSKFGGRYVVLLRLHSILVKYTKDLNLASILNYPNVVNATSYNDIQELLIASDILITDYSSSPFDFCYLNRPCFLLCPDYEKYMTRDRGQLKFNIKELPFPYSETESGLCSSILNFDMDKYKSQLSNYLVNDMKSFERGHASESVYNWLREKLF